MRLICWALRRHQYVLQVHSGGKVEKWCWRCNKRAPFFDDRTRP